MQDFHNFLRLAGLAFVGHTVEGSIGGKADGFHLPVPRYTLTVSGKGLNEPQTVTAASESEALTEARRKVAKHKREVATDAAIQALRGDWRPSELFDLRRKLLEARSKFDFEEVLQAAQIEDAKRRQQSQQAA